MLAHAGASEHGEKHTHNTRNLQGRFSACPPLSARAHGLRVGAGKCSTGGDFDKNRTNFTYPMVPPGLDWVSLDYYPDEGTLAGVPKLFQQHVCVARAVEC